MTDLNAKGLEAAIAAVADSEGWNAEDMPTTRHTAETAIRAYLNATQGGAICKNCIELCGGPTSAKTAQVEPLSVTAENIGELKPSAWRWKPIASKLWKTSRSEPEFIGLGRSLYDCEPLYSQSTLTALQAERDALLIEVEACKAFGLGFYGESVSEGARDVYRKQARTTLKGIEG